LGIPEDEQAFLLDIGCGSGLSSEVIAEMGHICVGCDISPAMLGVALEREVEADLMLQDMGDGLPFRNAVFDGAISISALQWLCNADEKHHVPFKRLLRLFESLYKCLKRGARAVFQFYPENPAQMEMISSAAMRCGFGGGILVDFPNSTKAKKYYLLLFAGVPQNQCERMMPAPLGIPQKEQKVTVHVDDRAPAVKRLSKSERKMKSKNLKNVDWILKKKERRRLQGKKVANDSKYSGRKRNPKF
jgi:18S rRNA (guanine1575-N7)-methyltransferase